MPPARVLAASQVPSVQLVQQTESFSKLNKNILKMNKIIFKADLPSTQQPCKFQAANVVMHRGIAKVGEFALDMWGSGREGEGGKNFSNIFP
jgi:hypothetical protein